MRKCKKFETDEDRLHTQQLEFHKAQVQVHREASLTLTALCKKIISEIPKIKWNNASDAWDRHTLCTVRSYRSKPTRWQVYLARLYGLEVHDGNLQYKHENVNLAQYWYARFKSLN